MSDIHFILDETDKRILSILANDGRINNLALAEAITLDHHTPERFRVFEEQVSQFPEVIRMSIVTGRAEDYLLQVLVGSMQEFEEFLLGKLNRIPGVINVHSSFEMRCVLDRQPQP